MSGMQIFTYKPIDFTTSEKSGENCYEQIKEQIETIESETKVRIIAVVSDAGGDAEKAQRWSSNAASQSDGLQTQQVKLLSL